jgi:hypothetical protein
VVIKFQGEPNQIVVETFNPATGASLGKQTFPLKNVSGDFYGIPKVIGWQSSQAYIMIDSTIYSLDVTGGKLQQVY